MDQDEIHERVEEAHRAGFQIGIHANGDVTIDMVLNAYERMQREFPRADSRHRIEHCSLVNDNLLARIKAVGAIPTPFYTYVHYHGNKWVEYGEEKMKMMFAHRSFLDYDIPVAGASDFVPGPYEPMMAIQSLVTRKDFAGRVWIGTRKGLLYYDGSDFVAFTTRDGLVDDHISALTVARDSTIWIGTTQGVSLYDGRRFIDLKSENGLTSGEVLTLMEDSQDRTWIGSFLGLAYYEIGNYPEAPVSYTHLTLPTSDLV